MQASKQLLAYVVHKWIAIEIYFAHPEPVWRIKQFQFRNEKEAFYDAIISHEKKRWKQKTNRKTTF